MSHCILCLKPGTGQCPESGKIFCSEKCQFVDFYLISGMKRERTDPKKLADRFSLSQLYQIFLRKSYTNLSEDNEFWYYAILKQRPELVWFSNDYDPNVDYVDIARTKIFNREIEEEEEVKPQQESEMDPRLKQALTLVSKSGTAIIDILLDNFDIKDVIHWSLVSKDFNRIITKSQYFWYLFLRKYQRNFDEPFSPLVKNVNTGKMVGVDYYELAKKQYEGKFVKVFQVEIISDSDNFNIVFEHPNLYEEENDNRWKSKEFSVFDIIVRGGFRRLLDELDDFAIVDPDGNGTESDRYYYTGYANDDEPISEAEPISFEDILGRNLIEIYENMEDGKVYHVKMFIERKVPETFTLTITYPQSEVQPFTKDLKEFRAQAYGTLANKPEKGEIELEFQYFPEDEYFSQMLDNLSPPPYFTLRGDYNNELNEDEWEMVIDNRYHLPGSRINLQRIYKLLDDEDRMDKEELDIEIKRKNEEGF